MQRKEIIVEGDRFILERLSPAVVRVTHRDQVGYFGLYKEGRRGYNPTPRWWPFGKSQT